MEEKKALVWMSNMLKFVLQHGIPHDEEKTRSKGRVISHVNNYQTIDVDSLMTKLIGCLMEAK